MLQPTRDKPHQCRGSQAVSAHGGQTRTLPAPAADQTPGSLNDLFMALLARSVGRAKRPPSNPAGPSRSSDNLKSERANRSRAPEAEFAGGTGNARYLLANPTSGTWAHTSSLETDAPIDSLFAQRHRRQGEARSGR